MIRSEVLNAMDREGEIDLSSPMRIGLGYCGPTDCCLVICLNSGHTKQYGVESLAWKLLSLIQGPRMLPCEVSDPDEHSLCVFVWRNRDQDIFTGGSHESL